MPNHKIDHDNASAGASSENNVGVKIDKVASDPAGTISLIAGFQPTGSLHIGNYLGAIRPFLDHPAAHRTFESAAFVADLHALTADHAGASQPFESRIQAHKAAAGLIACGMDPERILLFVQSDVPAHAELAWLLMCVARMGWLGRMTQFKDKGKNSEHASVGLFTYPVLMAADVLLYAPEEVAVGDDQLQHLEFVRMIASRLNAAHVTLDEQIPRNDLKFPKAYVPALGARIMSLKDGHRKMSKSDPAQTSRISLGDGPDEIVKKIMSARTDSGQMPMPGEDVSLRPEVANLIQLYGASVRLDQKQVIEQFAGQPFVPFKKALGEVLIALWAPMGQRFLEIALDQGYLKDVLRQGAQKAQEVAMVQHKAIAAMMGMDLSERQVQRKDEIS